MSTLCSATCVDTRTQPLGRVREFLPSRSIHSASSCSRRKNGKRECKRRDLRPPLATRAFQIAEGFLGFVHSVADPEDALALLARARISSTTERWLCKSHGDRLRQGRLARDLLVRATTH